jgi:hypothetical protein
MNKTTIISESLASFRARVAELESKLYNGVLYGQGYMVLARSAEMSSELVLGRFDRPGHYEANAKQCFCSLEITPDHLCGVSLYDRETAERVAEQCKADAYLTALSGYSVRHIRAEQERRLANWREMVAFIEAAQAKATE